MAFGKLFMIPTVLAENTAHQVVCPQVREVIQHTHYYLVENARTARRFISSLTLGVNLEAIQMDILDKKTSSEALITAMSPLLEGKDMGVLSEAGCPGIADPGALAVSFAHARGIQIVPIPGPSSMFLALMGSGFSGQSFAFHGYLPIDKKERAQLLGKLESESRREKRTQIFMETPFRNNQLLETMLQSLNPGTQLCIAKNLTASDELIQTKSIREWRKIKIDLHKVPTVFLIQST